MTMPGYTNDLINRVRSDIAYSRQRNSRQINPISNSSSPPVSYALPGGISGRTSAIIKDALSMVGKTPYTWGGTSKQGLDCSGLLYRIFNDSGVKVPRYIASQWGRQGIGVAAPNAKAGDIVYFNNPGATDHVGLYLGGGKFVEAQQSGTRVMVSNVRNGAQYRRL